MRVLAVSAGWMGALLLIAAVRSGMQSRAFERQDASGRKYYVAARIPGGRWLLVGPPLVLVLVWLWSRLSRPASDAVQLTKRTASGCAPASMLNHVSISPRCRDLRN